jgi:hypothetical protein
MVFSVTGCFRFLPGFRGVLHGFLSHSGYVISVLQVLQRVSFVLGLWVSPQEDPKNYILILVFVLKKETVRFACFHGFFCLPTRKATKAKHRQARRNKAKLRTAIQGKERQGDTK